MEGSIGNTFRTNMLMVLLYLSVGINIITSQQNFHVVTDPNMTIIPLKDINWRPQSMVSCAVQCVNLRTQCSSFLYDIHERQCKPGNGTVPYGNSRNASRLRLFVALSGEDSRNNQLECRNNQLQYRNKPLECNENGGFVFLVSKVKENYFDSAKACKTQGLKLVSLKTTEKVRAFQEMTNDYDNKLFWIGMDDLKENRRFRWLDDSAEINDEIRQVMFKGGEPNNFEGKEHCIGFLGLDRHSPFNDLDCTAINPFVCEATNQQQ